MPASLLGLLGAGLVLVDLGLALGLVPVMLRVLGPAHLDGGVAGPAAG